MIHEHLQYTDTIRNFLHTIRYISYDTYCVSYNTDNYGPRVVFFSLMAILEGGFDFPWTPYCLEHLVFTTFAQTNFHWISIKWWVVWVGLTACTGLGLNHHDINFLYNICGGSRMGYYLKVWDTVIQLISCLLDSNMNLSGEYIKVSGNWLAGEHTYPTSPRDIGWYSLSFSFFNCRVVLLGIALLILTEDFPFNFVMLPHNSVIFLNFFLTSVFSSTVQLLNVLGLILVSCILETWTSYCAWRYSCTMMVS